MQNNNTNQNHIDQSLDLSDQAQSNEEHDQEHNLVQSLKNASEGLLWLSEGEYPFQVVYWHDVENVKNTENQENFDQNILSAYVNILNKVKIVRQKPSDFFAPACLEQSWHNEAEKAEARRYQVLSKLLTTNLQNLQVYLIGETDIDVYILGRTQNGAIAGLQTKVIAT